jgi:hypothetical protein
VAGTRCRRSYGRRHERWFWGRCVRYARIPAKRLGRSLFGIEIIAGRVDKVAGQLLAILGQIFDAGLSAVAEALKLGGQAVVATAAPS